MSVLARPGASDRQTPAPPLPLVVSGAVAGVAAGVLSYLALAVIALGAWMLDPAGAQEWSQMLEAASGAWLAGLGVPPTLDGVTVTLLPIGFAALPVLALLGAGRWAADASAVARRGEALTVAFTGAVAFAAVGAVIAVLSRSIDASLARASATCGVVAFAVLIVVVMQRASVLGTQRWPHFLSDAFAGAGVALAALIAASSGLLAVALILNVDAVTSVLVELDPGVSGAVMLAVLTLGYLPNAIVWTMAYVIGPGVTVAAGTTLSAYAEPATAALPGFPLFAAFPAQPPPGAAALPLIAIASGALAGALLRRRGRVGLPGVAAAGLAGVGVGIGLGLLGWITSGSLGTTSLQGLGAAPMVFGMVGGGLVALGAVVVAAWPRGSVDG